MAEDYKQNSCPVEGCNFSEDGVCKQHGIEVERREVMKKRVDLIPAILTKLNWILGFLTLITMLIGGSYTFTYISNVHHDKERALAKVEMRQDLTEFKEYSYRASAEFRSNLRDASQAIKDLSIIVGKQGTQQTVILNELKELNQSIKAMIKRQEDHEDEIDEMYDSWGDPRSCVPDSESDIAKSKPPYQATSQSAL